MQERDSFYLGALLHDIGKFIERAKRLDYQKWASCYHRSGEASLNYGHRRYSAAFIRQHLHKNDIFSDAVSETYALWHHRGNEPGKDDYTPINTKGTLLKLIRIADDCASAERLEDAALDPQKYYLARLQSIFGEIVLDRESTRKHSQKSVRYLGLGPLTTTREASFPVSDTPVFDEHDGFPYANPVEQFLASFNNINNDRELLYLFQKYLYAVPAQTPTEFNGHQHLSRPDISLYDHLRTTAAIALCLYDEYMEGSWKGMENQIANDSHNGYKGEIFPAPCELLVGDLSGIHDFIFSIPSKKAAKSLKGRSIYVQLLSETCATLILDRLNLKRANLLFCGGGKFYILAPRVRLDGLKECERELAAAMLERGLYLSLGHTKVSVADFISGDKRPSRIAEKWEIAEGDADLAKKRKYSSLDAAVVFDPQEQRNPDSEEDPFAELTEHLRNASGYTIKPLTSRIKPQWQKVINGLGYEIDFSSGKDSILLNDIGFEGKGGGFRFMAKGIPEWSEAEIHSFREDIMKVGGNMAHYEQDGARIQVGNVKTFAQLAGSAFIDTGTGKIGVLKMDVDNLGRIFSEGFPERLRTISRMMTLSGNLQWFFEGYVNELFKDHRYSGQIYVIFSGGDDFFLVGAWHKVFELALDIEQAFSEFTFNPALTVSASLLVVDDHYPVSRFANIAEEELHKAKYNSIDKNSVSVFGEVLTWQEFRRANAIKEKLGRLVNEYNFPRSVIQKVLNGCDGLTILHERAVRFREAVERNDSRTVAWLDAQTPSGEKVWRMSYFLRDVKSKSNPEPGKIAEEIIGEYESVVFDAMKGIASNPAYIAVGARWAELANRKKKNVSTTTNTTTHAIS